MVRILVAIVLMTTTSIGAAQGVGGIGNISVIDRDTGVPLALHRYRGEYWIAGVPGARYAIDIRNRLGERLLVVASVDGVNVVSGETAAWDQAGYVLDPREHYQISGWRKSDSDVAVFTFTSLPNSYAARTGRPANVGVIGVAMFREQQPPLNVAPQERMSDGPTAGVEPPRAVNAPAASAADSDASSAVVVTGQRVTRAPPPTSPIPELKLGTGHGEREYSYVSHTDFVRLQPKPNELIRIHYDSLDNLVAMGIIRRPAPVLPEPPPGDPFPGSSNWQYVPDPPG
ncbi:MAG: hypothetical protein WA825_03875 [Steroidobacteraceae bacterium]